MARIRKVTSRRPGTAGILVQVAKGSRRNNGLSCFICHWPDREIAGPAELTAVIGETRAMFTELAFTLAVGPILEGDLLSARWTVRGVIVEGELSFFGNDILRVDCDRVVEYWPALSAGS